MPVICNNLFILTIRWFSSYTVPGWSRVEEYARDKWGAGDWDIIINPPGVSKLDLMSKGSLFTLIIVQG